MPLAVLPVTLFILCYLVRTATSGEVFLFSGCKDEKDDDFVTEERRRQLLFKALLSLGSFFSVLLSGKTNMLYMECLI